MPSPSPSSRSHMIACAGFLALAVFFAVALLLLSPVKTVLGLLAVLFCLHSIRKLTS